MEAKHDGEGAGGQQLPVVLVLVVIVDVNVIETVGGCYGKSVADLGETFHKID